MYKLTNNKKGFTLVELMVVFVLLGLGAFALLNIFRVSYRAYDKTEDRYLKQEAVKTVAEQLQKSTSLSAATKVELYDDISVVPTTAEKGYNYLYINPDDGLCYLRASGAEKAVAITNERLYIKFDIIPYEEYDLYDNLVYNENRSRGIKCYIAAVEDEFDYYDDEGNRTVLSENDDNIFYSLTVSCHFANMVENNQLFVNRTLKTGNTYERAYSKSSTGSKIETKDHNAFVVKYVSDITASGDGLLTESNINMYCFIATASYGTNNGDGTVGMLCDFRDTCLLTNPLGTAFVKAYYKLSPPIADVIAQHEPLRATVRVLLKPLVVFATYALNPELIYEIAPVMIITFAAGLALSVILVRMNKKRKKKE